MSEDEKYQKAPGEPKFNFSREEAARLSDKNKESYRPFIEGMLDEIFKKADDYITEIIPECLELPHWRNYMWYAAVMQDLDKIARMRVKDELLKDRDQIVNDILGPRFKDTDY